MNRKGMDKLMSDKFTLGGDAAVAAGPVGRTAAAETDASMNAEILSWSRSKGVFGGISLKGASLRPDKSDNKTLYGKEISIKEILNSGMKPPANATSLAMALTKYSPSSSADRKK